MVFPTRARSRSTACVRVRSSVTTSQLFAGAGPSGIGGLGGVQPAIRLLLDQGRLLKQPQRRCRAARICSPQITADSRAAAITLLPSLPHTPPPLTAPRRSTPRADVPATRDEHLRQLADLERRQTGRRDGDPATAATRS